VIRVCHVITRLIVGGAQETAILSCALVDPTRFESVLIVGPQTGTEGELFTEARDRGVEVVVLQELVREISPLKDIQAYRSLRRRFREMRPDVIHTHSSKAGFLGRLAARGLGASVVHTVHGWSFHEHMIGPVRAMWTAVERGAARYCERLVVVTTQDRDKGLAARVGRPEQYVTIRSGLELGPYRSPGVSRTEMRSELGIAEAATVVGAVMRLSPQKDPLTFVNAIARVSERVPDVHAVIVGDGPLKDEVLVLAAQLGLEGRLHLTGLRRDVPRLLQAFDVCVLTSLWEGLPRVVLQAMAAGIPVVATAVDGIREVVVDGVSGLLAPPGNAAALADRIATIVSEPLVAGHLREAAFQAVEPFDVAEMVRELEALYDQLLAGRAR
jgi:glycosyltransferase involved in cell wall biosynthesis